MYAVVDVETTGLYPGRHDRIAEAAVILIDPHGREEQSWSSLINPQRDLGPQHIHGITAAEARRAPTFEQIAGQLAQLLRGRVLVAHNLPFDAMFLAAEYGRLGAKLPTHRDVGLCTMRLASEYLPAGRSLADCCLVADVALTNAHSALHDARAAAGLLAYYLDRSGEPRPWSATLDAARAAAWPDLAPTPVRTVQREQPGAPATHFLSRLVTKLPRVDNPEADSYLDLLDTALIDRFISATEADMLIDYARVLGLGRLEVSELHQDYLDALAVAALEDGIVTEEEHEDLVQVAALLGLGTNELDQAMESAQRARHRAKPRYGRFALAPGDIVVLTGTFTVAKEALEAKVSEAGLVPSGSLTKRTRLLVAADVDSMSGKAEKACQYGIPIVGEVALHRILVDCVRRLQPSP